VSVRLLRNGGATAIGTIELPKTDADAAWTAIGQELSVAVFAKRPAGRLDKAGQGGGEAGAGDARNGGDSGAGSGKEDGDGDGSVFQWLAGSAEAEPASGPIDVVLASLGIHGGAVMQTPLQMRIVPPKASSQASEILIIATLALALVLMLSFYRKDTAAAELPAQVAVATLAKRALSGVIDVAPGLVLALAAFDLSPGELARHWPGQPAADTWAKMLPGIVAILVIAGHTLLGEAISGRSLGKGLTGLRVVNVEGQSPRLWQLAVRNAIKVLELIAPPMLILTVVSPRRQRLGDIVARTLVIEQAEDEKQAPQQSSEDQ
jgi:uncharacterized RDD family membrane protein YckC